MAFSLFYNERFPLRLINFIKIYLDTGGVILVENKAVSQLSKLQVIDRFFPSLFIRPLHDAADEAEYDYETCYILAPLKQGILSNWGSYKQKINNIEDCLLGNSRDDLTYKNYTAAQSMLRRAVSDLVSDETLFQNILANLQDIYETHLDAGQKQQINAWLRQLLEQCRKEETAGICTAVRNDGFSFERTVYDSLIGKVSDCYESGDLRACWAWLCLGSLFGNYTGRLLAACSPFRPEGDPVRRGQNTCRLLPSPSVLVSPLFCGREEYLKKIHGMFSAGNRVIFLYGIGGIGKTEIARKYASLFHDRYDVIIYAVYENSIKELIISEQPFETDPPVRRLVSENDDAYFRRKLNTIKKTADEKTLIILDNYNTENDAYLDELINGRYRLLITTRYDYSRIYPSLRIREFEDMGILKELFMKNYQGYAVEPDDPDLEKLFSAVSCHTYTVVLLAHHMENSGQTAAEMLDALEQKGIASLREKENSQDEAFRSLTAMFPVFQFSEEEQTILQLLSLMPVSGIPPMVFRRWAALPDTRSLLLLEQRGWIIRSANGITLHRLIQKVIRHVLPADTKEIRPFLDRAAEALFHENSWHFSKAEKETYCLIVRSVLSFLPETDENTFSFCVSAAAILGYSGYPETAVRIDEQLYEYCLKHYGPQAYETARSAFRTGWAYLFNPQLENALEKAVSRMQDARRVLETIRLDTVDQKAIYCAILNNLSKAYLTRYRSSGKQEDLSEAAEYAEQAVTYSRKWLDDPEAFKNKTSPAGSLLRLSDIMIEMEEYGQADELTDEAGAYLHALRPDNDPMDPDILSIDSRKAKILYHLGKYGESLARIEKNLNAYRKFYGEDNAAIIDQLALKIRCLLRMDDTETALRTKKEALEIARNIYPPDSADLRILDELV